MASERDRVPPDRVARRPLSDMPAGEGAAARRLLFASAGALAIALQVTLLRELIVALSGDETAVGLGLAAWLAGIAAGAVAARHPCGRSPRPWAGWGFALLASCGPVLVVGGRFLRLLLAPPPGEILATGPALALSLVLLAPAGALVGATFTALAAAAARVESSAGGAVAKLYVYESIGSLAGGIAITFLVVPNLSGLRGIFLIAAICSLAALPAAFPHGRTSSGEPSGSSGVPQHAGFLPGLTVLGFLTAALLVLGLTPVCAWLDDLSVRARFEGLAPGIPLLAWADTPYQHAAIGGDGIRHFYTAGQYAGSFPDPSSSETLAHTVTCLAPRTARVLCVGGVALGPLRFLLQHPVEHVDIAEPDTRMLALLVSRLPPDDAAALRDPRVSIVSDDPRRFLAASREAYDLVLVLEPDPITLMLSRFTTVEFYRLAASRLAPDGVIVVGLRTAPNVLTGETAAMAGAVFGALRAALPVVHAGPGPDGFLVAGHSAAAATLDPSVLAARWRERGIRAGGFVPEMFPVLFPPERVRAQEDELARAAVRAGPSTDERPVSFLHALARRQSISGGATGRILAALSRIPGPFLALLALAPSLIFLARRLVSRSKPAAALHAVASTGACGMAWSLLILFSYQTRVGALYGQLGFLTALFMLGLALGGTMASSAARAAPAAAGRWLLATSGLATLFGVLLAAALYAMGAAAAIGIPLPMFHGALLLAAGVTTGSVFPAAAGVLLAGGRDTAGAAGGVEAADHAGAAAAALVGALLFIPVFGLVGTAWLLVGVQGAALAAVALRTRFPESRAGNPGTARP